MGKTINLFRLAFFFFIYSLTTSAQNKSTILEYQIFDKETSEPIPFATVTLRKESIYRIADENGLFKLPMKKHLDNIVIEITSIGYETKKIILKKTPSKIYLTPNIEELDEIVISGFLSPKTILERAIRKKKENHPIKPFNFYRYGNITINNNDNTELNLELITKDCDYGYLSEYVISQRVEQIKWNTATNKNNYENSAMFFSFRQNAIRYANILHKRKFKKFELDFAKSNDIKYEDCYVISFKTQKNKWRFTNKSYPTNYSGFIYIQKESYAIVKVVENWTSSFSTNEIKKYFFTPKQEKDLTNSKKINELSKTIVKEKGISTDEIGKYYERKELNSKVKEIENLSKIIIKEENICEYSNILNDNKFYATKYFNRRIKESISNENKKSTTTYEADSYLFDFETKDVEEIEYYGNNDKNENSLHRVDYNKEFWNKFYKRKIKK